GGRPEPLPEVARQATGANPLWKIPNTKPQGKFQTPSSKHQTPKKSQYPNPNERRPVQFGARSSSSAQEREQHRRADESRELTKFVPIWRRPGPRFGAGDLELFWCLELGDWSFTRCLELSRISVPFPPVSCLNFPG